MTAIASRRVRRGVLGAAATVVSAATSCGTHPAPATPIAQLESDTGVHWYVGTNAEFGTVSYLQPIGNPGIALAAPASPETAAMAFLAKYAAVFEMKDATEELGSGSSGGPIAPGLSYASFLQTEGGIPVLGAGLSVHFASGDGSLTFVSGLYVPNLYGFSGTPHVTSDAALASAEADMATLYPASDLATALSAPSPQLVIYPAANPPALAYRFTLAYAAAGASTSAPIALVTAARSYVVDANTGAVLTSADETHGFGPEVPGTGTGPLGETWNFPVATNVPPALPGYTMYVPGSGGQTTRQAVYGDGVYVTSTSATSWDTSPPPPGAPGSAVDAYYYFGQVDLWWQVNNWNSYDNAGGPIDIVANSLSVPAARGAQWISGSTSTPPQIGVAAPLTGDLPASVAIDIMGHEFFHGVNDYSLQLSDTGVPGAIQESLADTFGNFVEHEELAASTPNVNNFCAGELWEPPCVRNLANPHATAMPDNVADPLIASSAAPSSIYFLSGIPSNAWYLTLNGGTNSTSGVTIPGSEALGWPATEDLYLALLRSVPPGSLASFADLARALVGLASSNGTTSSGPMATVVCAWYGVGVFGSSDLASFQVTCAPDAGSPTANDAGGDPADCGFISSSDVETDFSVSGVTGPTITTSTQMTVCKFASATASDPAIAVQYNFVDPAALPDVLSIAQAGYEGQGYTVASVSGLGQGAFVATGAPVGPGLVPVILSVVTSTLWFQITSTGSATDEETLATEILSKVP